MRDPIQPADIRVGDLVERRCTYPDGITKERFRGVVSRIGQVIHIRNGGDFWQKGPFSEDMQIRWYLIDRPDPDAALIEAAALRAFEEVNRAPWQHAIPAVKERWRRIASATLAAIRFDHDVTPRAEQ